MVHRGLDTFVDGRSDLLCELLAALLAATRDGEGRQDHETQIHQFPELHIGFLSPAPEDVQ